MDNENKKVQHLTEEQIAIYAEALATDNSANLSDDIKRHVKECLECSNEILSVSELLREEYKNSIADGLNSIKKSSNNKGFWLAAASIIVIAALGYLFTRTNNAPEKNLMAIDSTIFKTENIAYTYNEVENTITDTNSTIIDNSKADSVVSPAKKEIAIAFLTNKDLDKLVSRFEDASMRSVDIDIITPSDIKISKNDSINLEWNNTNNQYLTIEIFDNKGNKITSKTSSKSIVTITEISKSGLYYWKLINENYDLLFCGKINYHN